MWPGDDLARDGLSPPSVERRLRETFQAQLDAVESRMASQPILGAASRSPEGDRWRRPILAGAVAGLVAVLATVGFVALRPGPSGQILQTAEDPTTTSADITSTVAPPTSAATAATAEPSTDTTWTVGSAPTGLPPTPSGVNRAGGLAVAVAEGEGEGQLVAVDLASGAIDHTIATQSLEARWISKLELDWAGTAVYYQVQFEDHWFSCETSPGTIVRVDLATAAVEEVAAGAEPQISPDGTRLAYLEPSRCLPDPADANWVLTPYDTVVVRSLATGAEQRWVDPVLSTIDPAGGGDLYEAQLGGLVWLADDELAVAGHRLSATDLTVTGEVADTRPEAGTVSAVVGLEVHTGLVLIEQYVFENDRRQAQLVAVDLATGERIVRHQTGSTNGSYALDGTGANLAALDGHTLIAEGLALRTELELTNLAW